jgi:hypothetical protein
MKEAAKFSFIYSAVSILVLILWQQLFKVMTIEILAYSVWFYIFNLFIGLLVFLLFGFLTNNYKPSLNIRIVAYAVLCLLVLNSMLFFDERRILTIEAINSLWTKKYDIVIIGVHGIAIVSFFLTASYFYFKKRKIV